MPSFRAFVNGALQQAKSVSVGPGMTPAKSVKVFNNGALSLAFSSAAPFSISANPSNANGSATGKGNQRVTSNAVTITPTGGTAPYAYAWIIDNGLMRIGSPNMATTVFTETLNNSDDSATATCAVTDAHGLSASVDVSVFMSANSFE